MEKEETSEFPEVRKNVFNDETVIIAHNRKKRPDLHKVTLESKRQEPSSCPFCPGQEHKTPKPKSLKADLFQYPYPGPWLARACPNKFPALMIEAEGESYGAHEVIIDTPNHGKRFYDLEPEEMAPGFKVMKKRYFDLGEDRKLLYFQFFKNEGIGAGATIEHSHSQIIAESFLPSAIKREINTAWQMKIEGKECPYCEMIKTEKHNVGGNFDRIIEAADGFIVLEFFASRFPFETWILPEEHQPSFPHVIERNEINLKKFCQIFKMTLYKINKALGSPPFNFCLHTAAYRTEIDGAFHWHFEIMPRTTIAAGFEFGTGIHINPTSPEEAAKIMREII